MIRAVVFDVGETLIDETTEYGTWADWLDVPRHTFSAVFGAVIAMGKDYREVFQHFQPGFDLDSERKRRAEADKPETFGEDDLYPDARTCLNALRDMGIWVGVVGNQTTRAGDILRELKLPADMIATSEDMGVSKPDARFFQAVIDAAPCSASEIAYVGDRLAGFKGNTLLMDGQLGLARATLLQVLDRSGDTEAKQKAVTLADLAAVAVAEQDPELACSHTEAALDSLARSWYAIGMDRVRAVRQTLTQWESLPCVRRLDERLYDWNSTVRALTG